MHTLSHPHDLNHYSESDVAAHFLTEVSQSGILSGLQAVVALGISVPEADRIGARALRHLVEIHQSDDHIAAAIVENILRVYDEQPDKGLAEAYLAELDRTAAGLQAVLQAHGAPGNAKSLLLGGIAVLAASGADTTQRMRPAQPEPEAEAVEPEAEAVEPEVEDAPAPAPVRPRVQVTASTPVLMWAVVVLSAVAAMGTVGDILRHLLGID